MGKRLYKSVLGIPLYLILGLAIFVLFSAVYDFIVYDRSTMRYILIGASILLILITLLLHRVKLSTVKRIASRQLGG